MTWINIAAMFNEMLRQDRNPTSIIQTPEQSQQKNKKMKSLWRKDLVGAQEFISTL